MKEKLPELGVLLGELMIAKHNMATLVQQSDEHAMRIRGRAEAMNQCIQKVESALRLIGAGQRK